MKKKFVQLVIVMILIASIGLAACNGGPATAPDEVTVQFSWFYGTPYAGFFVADQLGYYAEENIEVTLLAGSPEIDPVAEVAAGNAQFGEGGGDLIMGSHVNGEEMVGIATIFRLSPMVVMALADSGIQHPQDLEGKTIGVISTDMDSIWDIQFLAMLDNLDIDKSTMTFVPNELFYGAEDLLSGRMDAYSAGFSTYEPIQAELSGHKVNTIHYSEYGVDFYLDTIFASSSLVSENPDLVERFVRATLKGYSHAIENPQDAADQTVKYDENLDPASELASMKAQIPLIDTGDVPIGYMDESVWQYTQDVLLEQGVISSSVDLSTVYTNEFVEKAK